VTEQAHTNPQPRPPPFFSKPVHHGARLSARLQALGLGRSLHWRLARHALLSFPGRAASATCPISHPVPVHRYRASPPDNSVASRQEGLGVRIRLPTVASPCLTRTRPLQVENRKFRAGVRRSVSAAN